MRRRALRQRRSILGLAALAIMLSAITVGWQYGWLHTVTLALTGNLPESTAEVEKGTTADGEIPNADGNTVAIDPIIFSGQGEADVRQPGDERASFAGPLGSRTTTASQNGFSPTHWEEPTAPTIPQQFPTIQANGTTPRHESDLKTESFVANRGRIVPVGGVEDNERPTNAGVLTNTDDTGVQKPQTRVDAESRFLNVDLKAIDRLIDSGEEISAHRELSKMYWNQPELRPVIQSRIEALAKRIYFSPQPHYMDPYEIQPGDQLRVIAKQYNVSWEYLAKLNDADPRRIRAGQKLKVIKGPFSALVELGKFELTIHAHGYYVRKYKVGIGKDGRSPVGRFTVLNKVVNPQYTDPEGRVVDSDDPQNPLGERWIDIGDSFGIHGTIDPESIGKAESRGCIRMSNEDVVEVYDLLTSNSEVIIRR